jgi:hypothetical protein
MSVNDLICKYPEQCLEIAQRGEFEVTHVLNILAYLESRGKPRTVRRVLPLPAKATA